MKKFLSICCNVQYLSKRNKNTFPIHYFIGLKFINVKDQVNKSYI